MRVRDEELGLLRARLDTAGSSAWAGGGALGQAGAAGEQHGPTVVARLRAQVAQLEEQDGAWRKALQVNYSTTTVLLIPSQALLGWPVKKGLGFATIS